MSAQSPTRSGPPPADDPSRVASSDMDRLGALSALLATLNDPRAGADALSRHVGQIPVLKARVTQRFLRDHPNWTKHSLPQQIALLGNRVLEGILLELLEDIVVMHSEVERHERDDG